MRIEGMGPDTPMHTNAEGASQSDIPYRFDLMDAPSMFAMAKVLYKGAEKYGEDNWRNLTIEDNLNHMIAHAYAYLAGDMSERHLEHVMCRAMFALGISLQKPNIKTEVTEYKESKNA